MDEQRQARIRALLTADNVGAFIGWRADELVMTTGYYPQWGASLVLFPRDGTPVLFIPALEPRDHLPNGVAIREYPWGAAADPWTPLVRMMRDALAERGLGGERITYVPAVQQSTPPVNSAEGQPITPDVPRLLNGVSDAGVVDITPRVMDLYTLKTQREVERIRLAHRVAAHGIRAFHASLEPGKTEADVAGAVEAAVQARVGREDGVWFARGWAFVQSGPNAADAGTFSRTAGRALEAGELVVIELGVCVNGYYADITRTGAVRGARVDPNHQKVYDSVREAQARAVRAVGPGVPAIDVDRAARDYIAAQGYGAYFPHHTGHHTGLRYHDPGPIIAPGSAFALQPGMLVTIEPGVYGAALGTGCRIEDNVLVTDTGYDVLSAMSRNLDGS